MQDLVRRPLPSACPSINSRVPKVEEAIGHSTLKFRIYIRIPFHSQFPQIKIYPVIGNVMNTTINSTEGQFDP